MEFFIFLDSDDEPNTERLFYSRIWFDNIEQLSDEQFNNAFRMSRECFDKLVKYVKNFTKICDLKLKLSLFIYYCAQGTSLRELRSLFGVPKTTIHRYVVEIAICLSRLSHRDIKFPTNAEFPELVEGLARPNNPTNAILVIDGTHVAISKPKNLPFNCYNRKGYFSIVWVCVVDYKKRIRGVVYNNGSVHDARVYRTSNLRTLIESIDPQEACVLGDPAFSGFLNIKSTYSTQNNPLTEEEAWLLSRQRIVVENTFGLLKNKFTILNKRILNGSEENGIRLVKSIFWLHNFIINNNL
jgi:hypothetical protein